MEHFSGGSGQEERVLRTLHEQLTPEAHSVTPLKAPSPFDESTIFPQEENGSDIDDMSGHGGAGGGVSDDNAKSDGGRSTTQERPLLLLPPLLLPAIMHPQALSLGHHCTANRPEHSRSTQYLRHQH